MCLDSLHGPRHPMPTTLHRCERHVVEWPFSVPAKASSQKGKVKLTCLTTGRHRAEKAVGDIIIAFPHIIVIKICVGLEGTS